MDEERLKELKHLFLFGLLSAQELAQLLDFFKEKRYERHIQVVSEKDTGDTMYVIISGAIKISTGKGDDEKELITLFPGDFFGEISLIERTLRTANASTLEESCLLEITRQDFTRLISQHPRLAVKMLFRIIQDMSRRLRRMNPSHESGLKF
ncbi:MAG: cyclic nucleotide-binding domain-containing protein [Candidatus Omnitrophota bacterium]